MRLVIDDYGVYLKKRGNRFVLVSEDRKEEVSADKVSQILILRSSAITSDAVELAISKNVDIVFFSKNGTPYSRIYPCKLGGTTLTRRNQLIACNSEKGVFLANSFIKAKITNMALLMKYLAKTRRESRIKILSEKIMKMSKQLPVEGEIEYVRNRLLGIEGEASKNYFRSLEIVISEKFFKGKRSKRPPEDLFNSCLNYGYGILYSEIERACIISGLDPYLGFLHTDRYGKTSLVYDIVEEFRQPIVDRVVITLIARGQIKDEDVDQNFYLTKSGRRKVLSSVIERLEKKVNYKGKKIPLSDVILGQTRALVKYLNEGKKYFPYIHRW